MRKLLAYSLSSTLLLTGCELKASDGKAKKEHQPTTQTHWEKTSDIDQTGPIPISSTGLHDRKKRETKKY
ncbi:hypothetical protein [Peribacillus loiseleuriae]|uniref:hypothetical protein n=1 Tax=Peribacillus loiseleuriae TaxID=1679170 RepID=UPI003CFD33C5